MSAIDYPDELDNCTIIEIKAVGDIMRISKNDIHHGGANKLWHSVGEYLFNADLTLANFELVLHPTKHIEKPFTFSIHPSHAPYFLGCEKFGRFDVLSIANNHLNDTLFKGINTTCQYFQDNNYTYVGGNITAEKQDDFPIIDVKGKKIAILAYSFSHNNVPLEQKHSLNLVRFNAKKDKDYDNSLILKHIRIAKEKQVDFIISMNHCGVEFDYYQEKRFIKRSQALIEAGIDCIICHHPHIINPVETYKASDGRTGVIFYSLGNITNWYLKSNLSNLGYIANIILESGINQENKNITRIKNIELKPSYHVKIKHKGYHEHRIVSLLKEINNPSSFINNKQYQALIQTHKKFYKYFKQNAFTYK